MKTKSHYQGRETHAYLSRGIGVPRERLLQVELPVDEYPAQRRMLTVQGARELASDLLAAADIADASAADVRQSQLGHD